ARTPLGRTGSERVFAGAPGGRADGPRRSRSGSPRVAAQPETPCGLTRPVPGYPALSGRTLEEEPHASTHPDVAAARRPRVAGRGLPSRARRRPEADPAGDVEQLDARRTRPPH